jgi:hypothetical protein
MEFKVGDHVFLKVKANKSSLKLGNCSKLVAHYCGSFEILESVGPRPSFGETWSCLTIFGTSTGYLKTERPSDAKIAGSRPLFMGFWV